MKQLAWRTAGLAGVLALMWLGPAAAEAASVAAGAYTGDGADNRTISGLGFAPEIIFIQADGPLHGVFRTGRMSDDQAAAFSEAAHQPDTIQQLTSDGFTLGASDRVNKSGTRYYWFALTPASGEGATMRYTGDGADNRAISGLGFAPDLVLIKGDVDSKALFSTGRMASEMAVGLTSGQADKRLLSLDSDGWQVGKHKDVNKSQKTYDAIVWKTTAGAFATGAYTGDGTDNRSITGAGFMPDVVLVKHINDKEAVFRTTAHSGTDSSVLHESLTSNGIQALEADGWQVGSDQAVNQNGKTFYWLAWKQAAPTPTPMPAPTEAATTTTTGTSAGNSSDEAAEETPAAAATPRPSRRPDRPAASPSPVTVAAAAPFIFPAVTASPTSVILAVSPTPTATASPTPAPALIKPSPATRATAGRVAGIWLQSLVHTSLAAESLPAAAQASAGWLQLVDTFLVWLAAALIVTLAGVFGYMVHLSARHGPLWPALRLALLKPRGDAAQHFDAYAPRHGPRGEILIPFSLWKTLARTEQRCLLTLGGVAAGKALLATAVIGLFIWLA